MRKIWKKFRFMLSLLLVITLTFPNVLGNVLANETTAEDRTNLYTLTDIIELTNFENTIDAAWGTAGVSFTAEAAAKLRAGAVIEIAYECNVPEGSEWMGNKTLWIAGNDASGTWQMIGYPGTGGVGQDELLWNESGTIVQITSDTLEQYLAGGWNDDWAWFTYQAGGPCTIKSVKIGVCDNTPQQPVEDRTNLYDLTDIVDVTGFGTAIDGAFGTAGFSVTADLATKLQVGAVIEIAYECTGEDWMKNKTLWFAGNNANEEWQMMGYPGEGGVAQDELRWNDTGNIVQVTYETLNTYLANGWNAENSWLSYQAGGNCTIKSVKIGLKDTTVEADYYYLASADIALGWIDAENFQLRIGNVYTGTYSQVTVIVDGQECLVTPYVFTDQDGTGLKLIADNSINWSEVSDVEIPDGTECTSEDGTQVLVFEGAFCTTKDYSGERIIARRLTTDFVDLNTTFTYSQQISDAEFIKIDGVETAEVSINFASSGEEHEIFIQTTEGDTVQTVVGYCLGDVHVDDMMNSKDLIALKKIVRNYSNPDKVAQKAADMNLDTNINESDLITMRDALLGGMVEDRSNLWTITDVISVPTFTKRLAKQWDGGGFAITSDIAKKLQEDVVIEIVYEAKGTSDWMENKTLWLQAEEQQIGFQGGGGIAKDELRWNDSGTIVQVRGRTLNKYLSSDWNAEGKWLGYVTGLDTCTIKSIKIGNLVTDNWDRTNLYDLTDITEIDSFTQTIDSAYGHGIFAITPEIKEKLQAGSVIEIEYECTLDSETKAWMKNQSMWFDNQLGFPGTGGIAADEVQWNQSGTIVQVTYETLNTYLAGGWDDAYAGFNYYAGGPCIIKSIKIGTPVTWVAKEATSVNNLPSEDEILAKRKEILQKGTFLYSGNDRTGYRADVMKWADKVDADSALALLYTYGADARNQNIIQVSTKIPGEDDFREITKIWADDIESGDAYLRLFTMTDLENMFGLDSYTQLDYVGFGNPNQYAYIEGIYYLPGSVLAELNAYEAELEESKQIIHTYDGNLSNESVSLNAKNVYLYMQEMQGEVCLTGQMESTWVDGTEYEMDYILDNTDRLPAIRGFDFIGNDFAGVTERAIEWWNAGGIVTICWHTGIDFSSGYNEAMADELNWDEAFIPGSDTYNSLLAGMDRAVPYLKQLEDAGVPVLWRPFHETDGGWFWWSKGGADNFVKLWQMMYSRYTDYWELDNLIWVLGYSNNTGLDKRLWYPGDDYVDIVGADNYDVQNASPELYQLCKSIAPEGMPIVYHECNRIPKEEEMTTQANAPWGFFLTWHTTSLTDENAIADLNAIYNSDYFITRDELPNLKSE